MSAFHRTNEFANSTLLTGVFAESRGHNLGASKESGEPNHAGDRGNQSVWWSWTAPADGNATITTLGSNFDTVLAVYTGATVSNLTSISSNDDIERGIVRQSQLTFAARAGVNYRIAVDGFNIESVSDSGLTALTIVLNTASKFGPATRLPDGTLRLPLSGEPNRSYILEASHDLWNWLPISTNTLIGKSFVLF